MKTKLGKLLLLVNEFGKTPTRYWPQMIKNFFLRRLIELGLKEIAIKVLIIDLVKQYKVNEPFAEYVQNFKGVFIDVGANLGAYCAIASRAAMRIAIEPDKRNFFLLNRVADVILPMAAWSEDGEKRFFIHKAPTKSSLMKDGSRYSGEVMIKTIKLDSLISKYNLHDKDVMIKIDVEGAELEVLKGGEILFNNLVKLALIEFHNKQNYHLGKKWLESRGFRLIKEKNYRCIFTKQSCN